MRVPEGFVKEGKRFYRKTNIKTIHNTSKVLLPDGKIHDCAVLAGKRYMLKPSNQVIPDLNGLIILEEVPRDYLKNINKMKDNVKNANEKVKESTKQMQMRNNGI